MQLHKIWHINANGNAFMTEFYTERNAHAEEGIVTFLNEAEHKSLSIPIEKILWIEAEVIS